MNNPDSSYHLESVLFHLESFDGAVTLAIKIAFAELMDPDDPKYSTDAWA